MFDSTSVQNVRVGTKHTKLGLVAAQRCYQVSLGLSPCKKAAHTHTEGSPEAQPPAAVQMVPVGKATFPFFPDVLFELHNFSLTALCYTIYFFLHRCNYCVFFFNI